MSLVESTGLKQPNVSNHLARMRDRGIVKAQRCGRQVYYQLADPLVESVLSAALRGVGASPKPRCEWAQVRSWSGALLEALVSHDERAAGEVVCDCMGAHLPMERLYVEVIEPCLARIGQDFVDGTITIGDEHLATATVERLMARATHFYVARAPRACRLVIGCVEGNWHSIGPRMIADVLANYGWQCTYLGADVPADTFVEMARAKDPHAILLSCAVPQNLAKAEETVGRLRGAASAASTMAIGLGGGCVNDDADAAARVGADFTARDACELVDVLERLLPTVLAR